MLRIEADGLTLEDIADLRESRNIVDRAGYVTTVRARKIDNMVVSSIEHMKEDYWHALQTKRKEAESLPAAA